jgi:hypothetical protein
MALTVARREPRHTPSVASSAATKPRSTPTFRRLGSFLPELAPGLVADAADADPTTVATLAVIGGGTIYGLAWLVVLAPGLLAQQTTRSESDSRRDFRRPSASIAQSS